MATKMATASAYGIKIEFLSDDTIAVYADDELITTVPMKKQFARDRAIAAKNNGNIFGRETALIGKFLEVYSEDYPLIAEIA